MSCPGVPLRTSPAQPAHPSQPLRSGSCPLPPGRPPWPAPVPTPGGGSRSRRGQPYTAACLQQSRPGTATLGARTAYQHTCSSCDRTSQPAWLRTNPAHQCTCSNHGPTTTGGHTLPTQPTGACGSDDRVGGNVPQGPTVHLLHKTTLSRPGDVADILNT